jgi:putative aldouronate transport system permease protein
MYDTFWIMVIPGLVSSFHVIILRTFINTSIPDTIFEAAKIDGANDFRIYWQIVLPLFKAGLATIALFNVVSRWNDWFAGMLYIENPKLIPLQTMLQKIQRNIDFIKNNADVSSEERELLRTMPTESTRMAITIISTAPILFAYPFFQRYFITGLTIGSVKG